MYNFLAFKNILLKKERTRIMATSLLLIVAIIYTSLIIVFNTYELANIQSSSFHYLIPIENEKFLSNRYVVSKEYITDTIINVENTDYFLFTLNCNDSLPFNLLEGVYPQDNKQILVPNTLALKLDEKIADYIVVGVYETNQYINNKIYTTDAFGKLINYYIKTHHVQWSSSLDGIAELLDIDKADIIVNEQAILQDTIKSYINDFDIMINVLILFIGLGVLTVYFALSNSLSVSDQDRRRELGLLKSIGMSPKQVKKMIIREFLILGFISSVLGIILGNAISYLVMKEIYIKLGLVNYDIKTFNATIFSISIVLGSMISIIAGHEKYKKYYASMPMNDINERILIHPKEVKTKSLSKNKFSWIMFLIYNERLRYQTRNVRYSFMLLLIISILFSFLTITNLLYTNNSSNHNADIIIKNISYDGEKTNLDFDFVYDLYKEEVEGEIDIDYVICNRVSNNAILTREKHHIDEMLEVYKYRGFPEFYMDSRNISWCDFEFHHIGLDKKQLQLLEPYLHLGTLESYSSNEFICILSKGNKYGDGPTTIILLEPSYAIGLYPKKEKNLKRFVENQSITDQGNYVKAVVHLPEAEEHSILPISVLKKLHLSLDHEGYLMATVCNDSIFYGTEQIEIKLKNSSLVFEFQDRIEELINKHNVDNIYQYELTKDNIDHENNLKFILNVILYPILILLFIISFLNISNVIKGNILIKKDDLKILSSIGLQKKQTLKIFIYEYLEGYINASFFVSIFYGIVSYVLIHNSLNNVLSLSLNLISTLIISVFITTPLLLVPFVIYHISKI